jgi:hypothetical protein
MASRGAKGQRPGGAQAPAPFRDKAAGPHDQALQRLRRGRRVRGHRRAGRRAGHRPGRRAQEVRGPGRHGAGHLRIPGAHGRGGGSGERRAHSSPPRSGKTWRPTSWPGDGEPGWCSPGGAGWWRTSPGRFWTPTAPPSTPASGWSGPTAGPRPRFPPCGRWRSSLRSAPPAGAWGSGSTPPSARAAC